MSFRLCDLRGSYTLGLPFHLHFNWVFFGKAIVDRKASALAHGARAAGLPVPLWAGAPWGHPPLWALVSAVSGVSMSSSPLNALCILIF